MTPDITCTSLNYLITLLQSFNKLVCKNNHTQDLEITIFRVKTMLAI